MLERNETHDPGLESWVESANREGCDFPIQNLPFAVFRRRDSDEPFRGGVAIGDQVLDLARLHGLGLYPDELQSILRSCAQPVLNRFMAQGPAAWSALRLALSRDLRRGGAHQAALENCLIGMDEVVYRVPCRIGDYTDFYTSIHHATNVGRLFRPDNPLLPNYRWIPIGYHGRSSSIEVSGHELRRPWGQTRAPDAETPSFGPCQRLDYELEVGIYIGTGNALGEPIPIEQAEQHVFGYCVFNDWSARDLQAWEYVPLGPFLAKNFASTISPWIVTQEALIPFRRPWSRDPGEPQPLDYLDSARNRAQGALDIRLEVSMDSRRMREQGRDPLRLGRSSFVDSYWTTAQMVAHHTVNGCNLQPGDFFGSGTQSGDNDEALGSLLELTRGGQQPLELPGGETRRFLEDGDRVIMRAWCEAGDAKRIGFGSAEATVRG
jgi:fumarylacetoacetase